MLLGLLFLADWYYPTAATAVPYNDVDRSIIRIHTAHRWPAAVKLDTSAPIVTTAPIIADAAAVDAAPVKASTERVRQAYAFEPTVSQKAPEKIRRRARPATKPSSREPGEAGQHFAIYQPSDLRNY